MAQSIRDVMTSDPRTVTTEATLVEAARVMRDADVGSVIVEDGGEVSGILTDRDIAVRAIAEGREPTETRVSDICTPDPTTLGPDDTVDDAVALMRERDVRRLPVVENGTAAGIVSLGDLAVERDPESALADISAAAPNN